LSTFLKNLGITEHSRFTQYSKFRIKKKGNRGEPGSEAGSSITPSAGIAPNKLQDMISFPDHQHAIQSHLFYHVRLVT
jgi:hypothetical protein